MKKIYVYEIFLGKRLIANSGEMQFNTKIEAVESAINFIDDLLKTDYEYAHCIKNDFDINVSKISEDNFVQGW